MEGFALAPDARVALGVSGGGDSIALLHLFCDWAKARRRAPPVVLCVDHGLREEARKEADAVVAWAEALGCEAHVLAWKGKKPRTDIEAKAREARYDLMGAWCRARGVTYLALAHTIEDQAETVLMRLARGSGVDGLSAMRASSAFPQTGHRTPRILRPLLEMQRADLRRHLAARAIAWFEDPMNEDSRFARVQWRALLPALHALGLTPRRLSQTARHLSRARAALDAAASVWLRAHAKMLPQGYALFDAGALAEAGEEIGLRALASALMAVSGAAYRPRFERLERLYREIVRGRCHHTLHGCRLLRAPKPHAAFGPKTLLIVREAREASKAPAVLLAGREAVWDGRFRVQGPKGLHVKALGDAKVEGLEAIPYSARAGMPAIYQGSTLVSAAFAGETGKFCVQFLGVDEEGGE